MNSVSAFKGIYTFLQKKYRLGIIRREYKQYYAYIKHRGVKIPRLTSIQRKQVDEVYKKYGFRYTYRTHELYMAVTGIFNPWIFPEDLFRNTVEYVLNNQDMRSGWDDKCYYDRLVPEANFAKTLVRNINGTFYDSNYNIISKNRANEIICDYESCVMKPSIDSGFGRSVKLFNTKDNSFFDVIKDYKKDYIIQERVKQHKLFSSLNSSSTNIVRFISLFINGQVHPLSATIRVGAAGAFTDLSTTKDGYGNLIIGVDEKGNLRNTAYHINGASYTDVLPNNFRFSKMCIPGWSDMVKMVIDCHSKMAHFGFIGWDITVDTQEKPVVIEYNVKGPGVLYYQYANGPLFGNLTEKVMEYVKNHNN